MKKRRLYYVPGLISLLGLPVLLLIWGPEDSVEQVVMKLNLPSEQKDEAGVLRYNRDGVMRLVKGKKVVSLWADDRPSHLYPETNPYRRSVFLLNEMARQQFTHDTAVVLKVCFREWSDYGDFVWMLNNTKLFDCRRYAFLDNDLFLFANPPPAPPDTTSLKVEPMGDDVVIGGPWTPPTKWEIFWRELGWKWRQFAYWVRRSSVFCIGFVLLIVLPGLVRLNLKRKPA